jgi:hypothetical protein
MSGVRQTEGWRSTTCLVNIYQHGGPERFDPSEELRLQALRDSSFVPFSLHGWYGRGTELSEE